MKLGWLFAASLFLAAPLVAQETPTAEAQMVRLIQERNAVAEAQRQALVDAWVGVKGITVGTTFPRRDTKITVVSTPSLFTNAPTVRSHTRIRHNPSGSVTGFTTTTVYPNLFTNSPTWPVTSYTTFTITK